MVHPISCSVLHYTTPYVTVQLIWPVNIAPVISHDMIYLLRYDWCVGLMCLHISTSLGFFGPRTIFTKKKCIGQVTSDLLYIRFTYYTKDNQQGCSRLSNGFSMWCLRPWMNHLPPIWWSTFRFRFLIVSWYGSLIWWRGIFLLISCLYSCFVHYPSFAYYFSSQIN